MGEPQVTIELARPDHFFTEGDLIEGAVVVSVDAPTELSGVRLERFWRAKRAGQTAVGGELSEVLKAPKKVEPGQPARIPFKMAAASSPVTHRGTDLEVGWLVAADVKHSGGQAKGEREFVQISGEPKRHKKGKPLMGSGHPECGTCLGIVLLIGGGFGLFARLTDPHVEGWVLPAALAALAVGVFAIGWGLRKRIAAMKLGRVAVRLRPKKVPPGGAPICSLTLSPKKDVQVNAVTAKVVRQETKVTGKKKSPTRHVDRQDLSSVTLVKDRALKAGTDLDLEWVAVVPDDASASMSKPRQQIAWFVHVHVDIANWPDYEEDYDLVVLEG